MPRFTQHTEETKKKMSEAQKKRYLEMGGMPDECKRKISERHKINHQIIREKIAFAEKMGFVSTTT